MPDRLMKALSIAVGTPVDQLDPTFQSPPEPLSHTSLLKAVTNVPPNPSSAVVNPIAADAPLRNRVSVIPALPVTVRVPPVNTAELLDTRANDLRSIRSP